MDAGCAKARPADTEVCVNSEYFPVAMAYVRWQQLERMYPHELALERGTLFAELDKPFCGMTVTGGCRR